MPNTREEAIQNLRDALPHIQIACEMAKIEYPKVELGVIGVNPDGSGKIVARFDFEEFLKDIAAVVEPTIPVEDRALGPWVPHPEYPYSFVRMNAKGEHVATLWPEGLVGSQTWCWRIQGVEGQVSDCHPVLDYAKERVDEFLEQMGYEVK